MSSIQKTMAASQSLRCEVRKFHQSPPEHFFFPPPFLSLRDTSCVVELTLLSAAVAHSEDVSKRVKAIRLTLQRQVLTERVRIPASYLHGAQESHRDGLRQAAYEPGEMHRAIEIERRSVDLGVYDSRRICLSSVD